MGTGDFLGSLEKGPRADLLRRLGLPPTARAADVDRAVLQTSGPRALIEGLPEGVLPHLYRWLLEEHGVLFGNRDGEDDLPRGTTPAAEAAQALAGRGLVVVTYARVDVLPPLVQVLREPAATWALSAQRAFLERSPTVPFFLALVFAAYTSNPPRLNQGGEVHGTWLRQFEKRWGENGILGFRHGFGEDVLRRARALVPAREGDRDILLPDPEAAARFLSSPPEDLALATLRVLHPYGADMQVLGWIEAAAEGRPERAASFTAIAELAASKRPLDRWASTYDTYSDWALTGVLDNLRVFRLVEVRIDPGPLRIARAPPAPRSSGSWIVQPGFDVLVPWDAPPDRVALLGTFADLEALDRVCRFRLGAGSIARGVGLLSDPSQMLTILEEGSSVPLPPNVRATVQGWLERARPLRGYHGEVAVAADDDQAAIVRKLDPEAIELAPRVFFLRETTLVRLYGVARAQGFAAASGAARPSPESKWAPAAVDVPSSAEEAREQIAATLAEARKRLAPPAPARAEPRVPPRRGAAPEPAERKETAFERALREAQEIVRRLGREARGGRPETGDRTTPDRRERDGEADDDRPEVGAKRAPATTGASESAGAPGAADAWEEPWRTYLPGEMQEVLEEAAACRTEVEILYLNSKGATSERRILPLRIHRQGGSALLLARELPSHTESTFVLDRITAVR